MVFCLVAAQGSSHFSPKEASGAWAVGKMFRLGNRPGTADLLDPRARQRALGLARYGVRTRPKHACDRCRCERTSRELRARRLTRVGDARGVAHACRERDHAAITLGASAHNHATRARAPRAVCTLCGLHLGASRVLESAIHDRSVSISVGRAACRMRQSGGSYFSALIFFGAL